jgi:hypothetical protein
MMLVLSPHDFKKLSPACRSEILMLLMNGGEGSDMSLFAGTGEPEQEPVPETEEVVSEEKQVISLTPAEAVDLLANISDRSSQSLKLFAPGQPVALDTLIGPNGLYRDYVELKRSFVGAVNRRLRTVSGNRNAALFSSDRDKTRIKVTAKTAQALRRVFGLSEPLPTMSFCDEHGRDIASNDPACTTLQEALASAWATVDAGTLPENKVDLFADVIRHFVESGLELYVRSPKTWNDATQEIEYEIQTVSEPNGVIINWKAESGLGELFVGFSGKPQVLAQPKF